MVEQGLISIQAVDYQLGIIPDSLSTRCTERVMRMEFSLFPFLQRSGGQMECKHL